MRKKVLSAVLAAVIFLTNMPIALLPTNAVDLRDTVTEDSVVYTISRDSAASLSASNVIYHTGAFPELGVMNAEMADTASFVKKYQVDTATFNSASTFGLNYNMKETKKYYMFEYYRPNNTDADNFWSMVASDQISMRFGAKFRGDIHKNFWNHAFTKKKTFQYMGVDTEEASFELIGPGNDDRYVVSLGESDTTFESITGDYIRVHISDGGDCNCGSPKFSNPFFTFADLVRPTLLGWYMTASDNGSSSAPSNADYRVIKNTSGKNSLYIHLRFSEPVRFADHSAAHSDVTLGLKMVNRDTNQEDGNLTAYLYALRGDIATFKLDIPEKIGEITPNHYIDRLTSLNIGNDNALSKKDGFPLSFVLKGSKVTSSKFGGLYNDIYGKNASYSSFAKTDSIFTDLVGNPMGTTSLANLAYYGGGQKPTIDFTSPYIESIDINTYDGNRNLLTAEVENGLTVNSFVKGGYYLEVDVIFSELTDGVPEVTLNIKDSSGEYIKAAHASSGTLTINNNPPEKTRRRYNVYLRDDMIPPEDGIIGIQSIKYDNVRDKYENPLAKRPNDGTAGAGKWYPAASKSIKLDVLAPYITLDEGKDPSDFLVDMVTSTENSDTFRINFTFDDDTSHGATNSSGTILIGDKEVYGEFTLLSQNDVKKPVGAYTWAIAPVGEVPTRYNSGTLGNRNSFAQRSGTQSLYITIPAGFSNTLIPLKLKIKALDFVGNSTETELLLNNELFEDITDRQGPEIVFTAKSAGTSDDESSGYVMASFEVSDASGVDPDTFEYAFVPTGAQPQDGDWIPAPITDDIDGKLVVTDLSVDTPLDTPLALDLYVRARDMSKNTNLSVSSLKKLTFDKTFVSYQVTGVNDRTYLAGEYPKIELAPEKSSIDTVPLPTIYALVRPRDTSLWVPNTVSDGLKQIFAQDNAYILFECADRYGASQILSTVNTVALGTFDKETFAFSNLHRDEAQTLLYDHEAIAEELFESYYGVVDVDFYIAYGLSLDTTEGKITSAYPITGESYEFWLANTDYANAPAVYDLSITWQNAEKLGGRETWGNDPDSFASVTTLAGEVIDISAEFLLKGYDDIDILDRENSFFLLRAYDGTDWHELYRTNITSLDTRIVLPDDLPYPEGKSSIRADVELYTTTGSGGDTVTAFTYLDPAIWVYTAPLSDFGIAAVETEFVGSLSNIFTDTNSMNYFGYEKFNATANPDMDHSYQKPSRIVLSAHETADNGETGSYEHSILFTTRSDYEKMQHYEALQVSNITQGVTHSGTWNATTDSLNTINKTHYDITLFDSAEELNAANHSGTHLPLVKDIDNIVSYQLLQENGLRSAVQTVIIHPDTIMEETVIKILPEDDGTITNYLYGAVESMPLGGTLYRRHSADDSCEIVTGHHIELPEFFVGSDTPSYEEFIVVDPQNNVEYLHFEKPENIWIDPPEIFNPYAYTYGDGNIGHMDGYLRYQNANRPYLAKFGFKMHVAFNTEYAERIGVSQMTYEIPAYEDWKENESGFRDYTFAPDDTNRNAGIFAFELDYSGDVNDIHDSVMMSLNNFTFLHKYNPNLAEGETEEVTLTITIEDVVGNMSDPYVVTFDMTNIKPAIKGIEFRDNLLVGNTRQIKAATLLANVPIDNVYPAAYSAEPGSKYNVVSEYNGTAWEKPFVNIYRDGNYDITFVDMFGEQHSESFTQEPMMWTGYSSAIRYDLGMEIDFSDPDPETGKVTLDYKSLDERIFVDIAQVTGDLSLSIAPGRESDEHTLLAVKVNEATLELDPELPLYILIYDPEQILQNRLAYLGVFGGGSARVVIPEFVKTPPQGRVLWHFDEFGTDTLPTLIDESGVPYVPTNTTGNVTAYLVTDRYVDGVNGTNNYHTFVYGGEETFTFEFEDLAGAYGYLTVSLSDIPITIDPPLESIPDTEAPGYSLEIYGKANAVLEPVNTYSPDDSVTLGQAVSVVDWVQGYMLSFQIEDISPTKLIVKKPGADITGLTYTDAVNDTLDGVTSTGTQVIVDQNADFDVVLIDANGNTTVIPFKADDFKLDLLPPAIADQAFEQTGLFEITAYIKLADNTAAEDEIAWIYPYDAVRVTEGTYKGRFAVVFKENKTITARFVDAVGNQGTGDITVDSIDQSAPYITKVTWTPANGVDTSTPIKKMTNTGVTALVEFSTQIADLKVTEKNGSEMFDLSVVLQNDQAIFTFKDSNHIWNDVTEEYDTYPWELILEFTGVNGVTATDDTRLVLPAVIDKVAPYAYTRYTEDQDTPKVPYVDIVFEDLSEDCYMQDTGRTLYKKGEPITKRITQNGKYVYKFIDAAGNVSTEVVEVGCIDNTPPLIMLSDLPDKDFYTSQSVTFRATLNEAGTITIGGKTESIDAPNDRNGDGIFSENECDWASFTVSENGGYVIKAADKVGFESSTYITFTCFDNIAPNIAFSPSTVSVMEGTDAAYTTEKLLEGIVTFDAVTKPADVEIALVDFEEQLLTKVGVHPIRITAKDGAGNVGEATRYLRVYSATEPRILLNGAKTFRKDVTILDRANITLDISNLPGGDGEPYTVFLRAGRWTEGQMKTRSQKLTSTNFTVKEDTYYTLYLVTQSRGTFLTYFIVQ